VKGSIRWLTCRARGLALALALAQA
jgi:hypothetical protein